MKTIYLRGEKQNWREYFYSENSDLSAEFLNRKISIGSGASIGERASIGEGARIGDWARIGSGASIGEGASITKVNAMFAINLYKYAVGAYCSGNVEYIQLGCYMRTRKEWEDNFWNNEKEFPNDNSEASNQRLNAFKIACFFLDSIKK